MLLALTQAFEGWDSFRKDVTIEGDNHVTEIIMRRVRLQGVGGRLDTLQWGNFPTLSYLDLSDQEITGLSIYSNGNL